MQLELAFLERTSEPAGRMKGPWDQIDPCPDRSAGDPRAPHRANARGTAQRWKQVMSDIQKITLQSPYPRGCFRLSAPVQRRPSRAQSRVRPTDSMLLGA